MEKSMIQDLDVMRTSMGYRKTFTTSFNAGGYELRKSKISNLPSYKKCDLSVKLPFVVVFQTIEIQRLSEEIQALRVALKDSERQAFNCQSYQIQIRELTDQCHQYDVELLEYKEEIEKLNMISQKLYQELEEWKQRYQNFDPLVVQKFNAKTQQCQNLENEIGKWKDRYRALERGKDKEMEDLKLAMENQRKSVLDREIGEMNIKFESQRSYLVGQIKKLEQAADLRQNQLTNAKFEVESLRIENEVNVDAGRKLKESQNKLNKLTEQLVRINELLRRKQEQISKKDANEDYLKQIIKTLQREKINQQNEVIKVPQLENAIKDWIARYSRLQNQSNQHKQQLERLPILEKDIEVYMEELDKLQIMMRTKIQQLSDSNQKVEKFKSLYEQSKKSEQKVPGLQRKITEMAYESERLNDILKKRLIEVQEGKSRIIVLEKALRVFEQAQPQKRRTQQELKKRIREVEKQKKQIQDYERQVQKIPELESIITNERNVQQQYARQIERLNRVVKDRTDENDLCKQKICHLEDKIADLSDIEDQLNNYKNQNNRMVKQIDTMNSKIKQSCESLEQLTHTIQTLQDNLQHYKIVEQKLKQNIENNERIMQELNNVKNELQKTEQNLLNTEAELNEAKNTIIDINSDKQILNRNLNIKTQQLEQAQTQINGYLEQIQQLREIQRCYHVVQEQLRLTQIRLAETDELLKRQRAKCDQLQYRSQMLINQLENIKVNGYFPQQFRIMYQQIKSNAKNKQRQMQNLVKKQSAMEKFADQVQGVIHNICQMMKVKNAQWLQINQRIQDSITNVNKMSQLQDENNDLRTQNLDLQSQIKMLNLEILEANVKKSTSSQSPISTLTGTLSSSSASSLNFNTVTSRKALDSVVEDQGTSRLSTLSNNRKVLGNAENVISMNKVGSTNGKSRIELARSSSKLTSNINGLSSLSNYQNNANPSSGSITSNKGIGSNYISSYISPPKISTTGKQAAESYFSWKASKANSVREPQSSVREPHNSFMNSMNTYR